MDLDAGGVGEYVRMTAAFTRSAMIMMTVVLDMGISVSVACFLCALLVPDIPVEYLAISDFVQEHELAS